MRRTSAGAGGSTLGVGLSTYFFAKYRSINMLYMYTAGKLKEEFQKPPVWHNMKILHAAIFSYVTLETIKQLTALY